MQAEKTCAPPLLTFRGAHKFTRLQGHQLAADFVEIPIGEAEAHVEQRAAGHHSLQKIGVCRVEVEEAAVPLPREDD